MAGMNRRPCASLGLGLLLVWFSSSVLTWLVPTSPDPARLAGQTQSSHRGRTHSKVLRMAVGGTPGFDTLLDISHAAVESLVKCRSCRPRIILCFPTVLQVLS